MECAVINETDYAMPRINGGFTQNADEKKPGLRPVFLERPA
jgi:hypothetical protein